MGEMTSRKSNLAVGRFHSAIGWIKTLTRFFVCPVDAYKKALNTNEKSMRTNVTPEEVFAAMQKFPAPVIQYREYDEHAPLTCPVCDWQGTAKNGGEVNTDSHFALDVSCPNCDKMLLVAEYPSGVE